MSRTSMVRLALALAAIVAWAAPVNAQISVVVSASSPYQPNNREVAEIFVGARTTWGDGSKIQIVDQPDSPLGAQFYSSYLRQTVAGVRQRITRLIFSGEALPPQRAANSAEVRAAVAGNPRAIGYIATSALDNTVQEIHRITP